METFNLAEVAFDGIVGKVIWPIIVRCACVDRNPVAAEVFIVATVATEVDD